LSGGDRYDDAAEVLRQGLAYARKLGNRYEEAWFLGFGYPFYANGAWDEVLALRAELPHEDWTRARLGHGTSLSSAVPVFVHRGRLEEARQIVAAVAELECSADVQERAYYGVANAQILLAEGDRPGALRVAEAVFAERESLGIAHDAIKESFALAVQAALELGRLDKADELLTVVELLQPGVRPQFLNAHVARFRAQLAARAGDAEEAERLFKGAGGLFRELAFPFYLAVTRLEHAEWLASQGRTEETQPLMAEARGIFEDLEARPFLERLGAAQAGARAAVPAS
jgi:tetratricopeptide (TPR) repeat protein